jgi:hypothetical protein
MEAIIERCCGLDVHKDIVVACMLIGPPEGRARKEIGTLEQLRRNRNSFGPGCDRSAALTSAWSRPVCTGCLSTQC